MVKANVPDAGEILELWTPTGSSVRAVPIGIKGESVVAGDHVALFYDTDEEFANSLGFIETGLKGTDLCILFGILADTQRTPIGCGAPGARGALVRAPARSDLRGHCGRGIATLRARIRQGCDLHPLPGNAAVGREGWPATVRCDLYVRPPHAVRTR